MKQTDLNMERFLDIGTTVLSGRPIGLKKRISIKLENLEKTYDKIIVDIPDKIDSINTSFFLGFWAPSVLEMGKEGFLEKYEFKCNEYARSKIMSNIDYTLKNINVLTKREN